MSAQVAPCSRAAATNSVTTAFGRVAQTVGGLEPVVVVAAGESQDRRADDRIGREVDLHVTAPGSGTHDRSSKGSPTNGLVRRPHEMLRPKRLVVASVVRMTYQST